MRPFLVYTVARMLVLLAVALLLSVIGLHGFVLAAFAVVLSLPLSYLLLARQRIAFGADVERRLAERRARTADLRTRLRSDDAAGGHPAEHDTAEHDTAQRDPASSGDAG